LIDVTDTIQALRKATELNLEDTLLKGSTLHFPAYGQLVVTGDMHGHRRNFAKLQRFCDLAHAPARHVMLHELIHEEPEAWNAPDTSYELLIEAARWKCEFPDQVHFLQSNHELSQLTGHEIAKNGRIATFEFERSIRNAFAGAATELLTAISEFIRSLPLAGRTATGIFIAHSLPSPRDLPRFDPGVLSRPTREHDLVEPGSAYLLVWGRYQTAEELEALRLMLSCDYFVCGHQPQEGGYDVLHERMLILASDHNHGVFLPFDLSKPYTVEELVACIRKFVAVP
jgi:hypothetical protein